MTDLEKAARLALEALEYYQVAGLATTRVVKSITALRQALSNSVEQPAQQQKPVFPACKGMNCGCTDGVNHSLECQAEHAAAFAGGTFVPMSKQKPVGYVYSVHGERIKNACIESDVPNGTPLYISPQRKPLTDEAVWSLYKNLWMFHPAEEPRLAGDILKFARAIEAAHGIKEKNT